jgi:hypothetical protein
MKSLGRDILSGTIAGVVSGVAILCATVIATQALEHRLTEQQNRVENLRFVRDISTRNSGPMPFRTLDLEDMNLSGLRFPCRDKMVVEACFLKADFTGAKLSSTDMSGMDLEGADLTGADLRNADLAGTNLSGAILYDAKMDGARLDGVCYSPMTIWPKGIDPPRDGNGEICDGL